MKLVAATSAEVSQIVSETARSFTVSGDGHHECSWQTEGQTEKSGNSGYATWFTAGGAIRIAHYDVIDDVITRKL